MVQCCFTSMFLYFQCASMVQCFFTSSLSLVIRSILYGPARSGVLTLHTSSLYHVLHGIFAEMCHVKGKKNPAISWTEIWGSSNITCLTSFLLFSSMGILILQTSFHFWVLSCQCQYQCPLAQCSWTPWRQPHACCAWWRWWRRGIWGKWCREGMRRQVID